MFSIMFCMTCDVRISVTTSSFLLGVSLERRVGCMMCSAFCGGLSSQHTAVTSSCCACLHCLRVLLAPSCLHWNPAVTARFISWPGRCLSLSPWQTSLIDSHSQQTSLIDSHSRFPCSILLINCANFPGYLLAGKSYPMI